MEVAAYNPEAQTQSNERRLLVRYRVLAFSTATLLIILVFAGIPLQLAANRPQVVNDVGTLHGFLYLAYLCVAFQLTRKLDVPKWQMALVLLAGTVPFCAFVAERKMTHRFEARFAPAPTGTAVGRSPRPLSGRGHRFRQRWLSRRALLLHLEVLIVAPGCAVAGWWQATRALAGNGLSWVYSVEWPIFALLAVAGWWHLVHEDPEQYRLRKRRSSVRVANAGLAETSAESVDELGSDPKVTVETVTARLATGLALLVGADLVLGMATLVIVPFSRPTGWEPPSGAAVYAAHALIGIPLVAGTVALLVRTWRSTRISRLSGRTGAVGVFLAAVGGLMTVSHPLRFGGTALMLLGGVLAGFGYLFPALERLRR